VKKISYSATRLKTEKVIKTKSYVALYLLAIGDIMILYDIT